MIRMPLAVVVLTLLPTAPAAAQTEPVQAVVVPPTGTLLDVVAEGRTTRVPDLATVRAGVVSQAPTAAAALADNARRMTQVLQALKRAGVADRDLTTASVSLSPQYRYVDNQPPAITGYQASNSVAVRFRDVGKAGTVLDTLVAQGANQIDGPDLAVSDPDAALDQARTDAVARARARAELYAKAAGLHVGRIVSIAEAGQEAGGPEHPPIVFARAAAAEAHTSVAPGEKDITATLAVRFMLN